MESHKRMHRGSLEEEFNKVKSLGAISADLISSPFLLGSHRHRKGSKRCEGGGGLDGLIAFSFVTPI
ncbi:hypothetical protein IE53DRAFT_118498 [Violaceomyces palustris]|uniref:Uncharacterized protein n=1 Tax=Violaceomyces palustris TaxID=1673888 RepID=A0ACD0NVX6_9BASI|nr:hypothetical protein IE53DRAFT_118498 [Violaceomyces palustris]